MKFKSSGRITEKISGPFTLSLNYRKIRNKAVFSATHILYYLAYFVVFHVFYVGKYILIRVIFIFINKFRGSDKEKI